MVEVMEVDVPPPQEAEEGRAGEDTGSPEVTEKGGVAEGDKEPLAMMDVEEEGQGAKTPAATMGEETGDDGAPANTNEEEGAEDLAGYIS